LLSKHVAEDLEEYPHWQPHLHELGECEVKHGVRVSVVNVYIAELGNPSVPEKLKAAPGAALLPCEENGRIPMAVIRRGEPAGCDRPDRFSPISL